MSMDTDGDQHRGQVPLPGFGESAAGGDQSDRGGPTRADGVRHVRRMSNWTAAALIVGTGAATVALAHHAIPVTAPAAGTASATTGAGTAATTQGKGGPQVSHAVATTSGSGVVVTTMTHTANGKVIVTHVRHSTYRDN
jgi:hypothetical protein